MGSVFLAEDSKLGRNVALKVMLPKIASDPVAKQRFLREARAAASLKSDHIVTVHHVDEENNIPYLAMELLEGRSLDEAIRSGDVKSFGLIVHIALGIAKGLADAHERGMIHRDIKPGNVWLENYGATLPRVKLLDFGLARIDVEDTHLTHVTAIVGTPAFMAPEQARSQAAVDARCDLFSLGCVLYYLCTSEVPFKAESMLGTLMALAVETPVAPANRNAAVPTSLSRLIMHLLEKDASKRPQTAREVVAALIQVQKELDTIAAVPTGVHAIAQALPIDRTDRPRVKWLTIAPVTIVLLMGIGFVLSSRSYNVGGSDGKRNVDSIAASPVGDSNEKAPQDLLPKQDRPLSSTTEQSQTEVDGLLARFKSGNPKFQGTFSPAFTDEVLTSLEIVGKGITDLSPLADTKSLQQLVLDGAEFKEIMSLDLSPLNKLPLKELKLQRGYITRDVSALRGMQLEVLGLDYSQLWSLSGLEGMPLRELRLWGWYGSDLTPLRGLPLQQLNIGGYNQAMDLGPLAGAPLEFLCLNMSKVSDLSPLKGMPLKHLLCSNTPVSDLSPVIDCPLEILEIHGSNVRDISMAKRWPLTLIIMDYDMPDVFDHLKQVPTLERINDQPAADVLAALNPRSWQLKSADFVNSVKMEFVRVPAGKTRRGTGGFDQHLGPREIEITRDFYLGRYEVTQAQWTKVMDSNPSYFRFNGPGKDRIARLTEAELGRFPVESVSWADCQSFLQKLNELENDKEWIYRLPTEAEWTYACHGGPMPPDFDPELGLYFERPTLYMLSYYGNTQRLELNRTCRVGLFPPSTLGMFDMLGNVWEWCDNSSQIEDAPTRWICGGGFGIEAEKCKATTLYHLKETASVVDLGLRVARVRRD